MFSFSADNFRSTEVGVKESDCVVDVDFVDRPLPLSSCDETTEFVAFVILLPDADMETGDDKTLVGEFILSK